LIHEKGQKSPKKEISFFFMALFLCWSILQTSFLLRGASQGFPAAATTVAVAAAALCSPHGEIYAIPIF